LAPFWQDDPSVSDEERDRIHRAYEQLTDEEKIRRARAYLAAAPSDPEDWNDQTAGVALNLAELSTRRQEWLAASPWWDRFLAYLIFRHGAGDEEYVLSAALNAGSVHFCLEDSLGVLRVTEPVYNYWANEQLPTLSNHRRFVKLVRLYWISGRPREASRLNKRLLVSALRRGRVLRFARAVFRSIPIGVMRWSISGRSDLEGKMLRPRRRHWSAPMKTLDGD
jgi:hypothetical protein